MFVSFSHRFLPFASNAGTFEGLSLPSLRRTLSLWEGHRFDLRFLLAEVSQPRLDFGIGEASALASSIKCTSRAVTLVPIAGLRTCKRPTAWLGM
jgi:hypothetical protein